MFCTHMFNLSHDYHAIRRALLHDTIRIVWFLWLGANSHTQSADSDDFYRSPQHSNCFRPVLLQLNLKINNLKTTQKKLAKQKKIHIFCIFNQ